MPHSSQKDVNAPMDAWDRQRCALALHELKAQVELLTLLFKRVSAADLDDWNASNLDKGLARIASAVSAFADETN